MAGMRRRAAFRLLVHGQSHVVWHGCAAEAGAADCPGLRIACTTTDRRQELSVTARATHPRATAARFASARSACAATVRLRSGGPRSSST